MSSTRVAELLAETRRVFDRPPGTVERGLDVDDAALLQLRRRSDDAPAVDTHDRGRFRNAPHRFRV